ncbi:MAG: hypothetical protein AAFY36_08680 [Bacteroidota bacterium]
MGFSVHPTQITLQQLFFIDFCGAAISTLLHFLLLAPFDHLFGLPAEVVYLLGSMAFLFCCFSGYQYLHRWRYSSNGDTLASFLRDRDAGSESSTSAIKVISVLNFGYCLVSIGFLTYYFARITSLGWAYFLGEILIVSALAYIEFKAARVHSSNRLK